MSTDVVIATSLPTLAGGGERLLHLATWLTRLGLRVEIVALGEGTRPDTAAFGRVAPTTVVDRFRRRGVAAVPWALGLGQATRGWKRVRLRRWLARRRGASLVIHDPLAASLVRYASERPARVIGSFPEPGWSLERMRAEDRSTLQGADAWLTCEPAQTDELSEWFDGPVLELSPGETAGGLVDREHLPAVRRSDGVGGAVVLVPPVGLWDTTDHAVEVAWQLHRADPAMRFRWVADSRQDRWLAQHDVRHAGLDAVVDVVASDDPQLLVDVAAVVRTGYSPSHGDVVLAAALGGVPVLGTCTADLVDATEVAPFAVEELADAVLELVRDPTGRSMRGEQLREGVAHLDLDQRIGEFAELVLGRRP